MMVMPKRDWRTDLADYLIAAGTVGLKQSEIVIRFQGRVAAEMLEGELNGWLAEERVQKFKVASGDGKGRPAVIWRATIRLPGSV